MNKTLEAGKTLLVDGPASVTVLSGKVEIFGFQTTGPYKAIIREGKRLPFTALETAQFWVSAGPKASIEEVDGSTIPASWAPVIKAVYEFKKKPVIVMVIGGTDSGKTSFCTYLTNMLVSHDHKVAVIDEDLGQSDIGPPCTVAYAYVSAPVTDMFNLQEQNAVFVGTTSPGAAISRTVEAAAALKTEILNQGTPDFIVVNTDGWVTGEDAVQFKSWLAKRLNVDIVFCLQDEDTPILCASFSDALPHCIHEIVESPFAISQRGHEKRRNLRELAYAKYLKNAKVKAILGYTVAIKGNREALHKRKAVNLLVGMYGTHNRFLGIGIIDKVDYTNAILKIFTPVKERPALIVIGKVRLNKRLQELPNESQQRMLPVKESAKLLSQ